MILIIDGIDKIDRIDGIDGIDTIDTIDTIDRRYGMSYKSKGNELGMEI